MTTDEFHARVRNYVDASAKMLNLSLSYYGAADIADKLIIKSEGPSQIMNDLTPLRLFHMIHEVMSEDIRTAEEIREELAKSTRQIPLELHPEDHLDTCSCMTCIPEAKSGKNDSSIRFLNGEVRAVRLNPYYSHVAPQECDYDCPTDCSGDSSPIRSGDSPEDDRAIAMRSHPAGKGRAWSDSREH